MFHARGRCKRYGAYGAVLLLAGALGGCHAPGRRSVPGTIEAGEATIETPKPSQWKPPRRRCHRYRGRGFCDGPRRIPAPHGPAKARAERLKLGTREVANHLMMDAPRPRWVAAAKGRARETLLWPVPGGRLVRGFGYVRRSRPGLRHDGIDIHAKPGTHVRAVNDGLVAYADNGVRGMGNLLLVVHSDGTTTLYAHLRAAYVFAGQRVRRGQVLGELGNTGLSRAPHLHFEWRRKGHPRDPMPRLTDLPSELAAAKTSD